MTAGLLQLARKQGLSCLGLKPVAAGCDETSNGLCNEDALLLQSVSSVKLPYQQINPVALKAAASPHIAAQNEKRVLSADRLAGFCRSGFRLADVTFVEGAGGWRVPINPTETMADLVRILQLPVILVVGMRLGCLNHALLTAEIIRQDGLLLAGWVANVVDPHMMYLEENIQTLQNRIHAPCLGVVPFLPSLGSDLVAEHLSLPL